MWELSLPFITSFSGHFLYKLRAIRISLPSPLTLILLSRTLKKIVSLSMSREVTEDTHTMPNCSLPQPSLEHNLIFDSPWRAREVDGKLQPK